MSVAAAVAARLPTLAFSEVHPLLASLTPLQLLEVATVSPDCCDKVSGLLTKLDMEESKRRGTKEFLEAQETLQKLSFADRFRLSQTTPQLTGPISDSFQYAATQLLSEFGLRFQHIQLLHVAVGTCISGSAVTALVHCGPSFHPNDIDFYAPVGRGEVTVRFLDISSNYRVLRQSPMYNAAVAVSRVWWLEHCVTRKPLNVMECRTSSTFDTITSFHSTAVMNAWTAEGLWIAYPDLTTQSQTLATPYSMRGLRPSREEQRRFGRVVSKYFERGFRFHLLRNPAPHVCGQHFNCPVTLRTTDDAGCWVATFPSSWMTPHITLTCAPYVTRWTLHGPGCQESERENGVAVVNQSLKSDLICCEYIQTM
ncbi:hypothetical protein R3P38DRAFT_2809836 [Favolaschia claudopus]|uniref:F-box protein n=1 Tax=Favolaschia claudopus TaxID=2862362 RepID=A0AAV9ZCE8_9AGAR